MRFAFTQDQLMLRDLSRQVLSSECTPDRVRNAWDSETGHDDNLWGQLVELGLVGMLLPEEAGGMGMSELDFILPLEESGRVALPLPLVETAVVGGPLIAAYGSDALKSKWLTAIAEGSAIVSLGLTNGADTPILSAHVAHLLILQDGASLHAVPRRQVTLSALQSVDRSRRLFRVDWTPSAETELVTGDAGREAAHQAFDRGALAAAAQLVGVGRQLIDMTVEYVKVREQFGKAIGTFQAVQHRLADTLVELEFARPLVYRAAYSVATDDSAASSHVSMAKALASDAATRAAKTALQLHGAIGYTFEYDLQLWLKRAWALAAAWGDAAWHRDRVGRAIL